MNFDYYMSNVTFSQTTDLLDNLFLRRMSKVILGMHAKKSKQELHSLFHGINFTKRNQTIFTEVLNVTDEHILRIYWEEFKLLRHQVKVEIDTHINAYIQRTESNDVYHLLNKCNITYDKNESIENIFINHLINYHLEYQESVQKCKICYHRICDTVLSCDHKTKLKCAMCEVCFKQLRSNKCPFCNVEIKSYSKICYH